MFYLPKNHAAIAVLPFCKMDADGYAWENGTDNKYEMVEIIQRNGNVKGFLLTRFVDIIDHRSRAEENGIYALSQREKHTPYGAECAIIMLMQGAHR